MSEIEAEYEERGVVFVAVNVFEPKERGLAFVEQTDLDYAWWWADAKSCKAMGIQVIPTQVILNREGRVVWTSDITTLQGGVDAITAALDEALAGS